MTEERHVSHVCEECGSNNFICTHSHAVDEDGEAEWYFDEAVCIECDHSQQAFPDVRLPNSQLDFMCPFCGVSGTKLPDIVIIVDGIVWP